ncbi:MAG: fluoride efflux transporter CrcB [Actinomycetes bacterium]
MRAVFVALGAGIGAPLRYLIDQEVKKLHRSLIPVETLFINTVGSFVLGLMINSHGNWLLIIGTGFAGAFTTWSTFAVETHHLLKHKHRKKALLYLALTLVCGISAAALGVKLAS